MKQTTVYNLMLDNSGKIYIEEYSGWLDDTRPIGYYKRGDRWYITEMTTGCKLGNNNWGTRKEAVAVVDKSYWYVDEWKEKNKEKYANKKEQFEKALLDYKKGGNSCDF